jgi:cysteine desulfurase/selenocysteine lyase
VNVAPRLTRRALGQAAVGGCFAAIGWQSAHPAQAGTSVSQWRADFPCLDQRIDGHPLIYLDSAATTQRPQQVIEALADYYRHDNANPGAALHSLARRAHEHFENARATVAAFIHAADPEEIVWTRGTTEGINLVAAAWADAELRRGDEILLTIGEHASNMLPWQLVARRTGAAISFVAVDASGRIALDDLDRKLTPRTRLLAFSHVSNVAGYVNPAAEICARARRSGARVLIDAAQSAPHIELDVTTLGCDFLVFSSHKMLGPMGVGVLWAHRELLEQMSPYQAGSNMAHAVDLQSCELEHAARKFGAGTPNVSGPVALAAAVGYLQRLGAERLRAHERILVERGLEILGSIPGLRILGPATSENRLPVFSFSLGKRPPAEVLRHLDARGIAVRAGDLAALPLLQHFGLTSAVRASAYLYSEPEELEQLGKALRDLA